MIWSLWYEQARRRGLGGNRKSKEKKELQIENNQTDLLKISLSTEGGEKREKQEGGKILRRHTKGAKRKLEQENNLRAEEKRGKNHESAQGNRSDY